MRNILRLLPIVLLVLFLFSLVPTAIRFYGIYDRYRVLAPFTKLASAHTSESIIIKKQGKPKLVIRDSIELQKWADNYVPQSPMPRIIKSRVLVYGHYPYMIYLFMGPNNHAEKVILGVNY